MSAIKDRFIIFILIIGSFLLFTNLGDMYLWQDEATTTVLARNILRYGLPRAYDGKNLVTDRYDRGDSNSQHIWIFNTWLQYYLTAGSFLLFGINTFSARFPFALLGLISILLYYYLFQRIVKNRNIARISTLLLLFSVPYLLHMRQCRYYALVSFATAWMVISYLKMVRNEKFGIIQFVISSLILFHSLYVYFFINFAAILLHFLLFHYNNKNISRIFKATILIFIFSFPFFLYIAPWGKDSYAALNNLPRFSTYAKTYLLWINNFMMPLVFLPVFFLVQRVKKQRQKLLFFGALASYIIFCLIVVSSEGWAKGDTSFLLWVFILIPWILYGIVSLVEISRKKFPKSEKINSGLVLIGMIICFSVIFFSLTTPYPYFRYIIATVPLFCLILGIILHHIGKKYIIAGLLVLLVCTNFLSVIPFKIINEFLQPKKYQLKVEPALIMLLREQWLLIRYDLASYFYELTHEYKGPNKGIATYLNEHAKPEDIVKTSYGDLPLMFYTNLRILSRKESGESPPDWAIERAGYSLYMNEKLRKIIVNVPYEKIELPYPNIYWNNRPDPLYHKYRTVENAPKIVLLRKINTQN